MWKILKGVTRAEQTAYNQKYYAEHRNLLRRRSAAYKKAHPDRVAKYKKDNQLKERNRFYLATYGITLADFETQIAAQRGLCPIGNHPFGPIGKKKGESPCMDHDHKTGKNRLVLCYTHNASLGGFHDSPRELQDAITYLKQFEEEV